MDADRFDTFAKGLTVPFRRRAVLHGLGTGALVALLGRTLLAPREAEAHHCKFAGCGCTSGTRHPCGRGLFCCSAGQGMLGGAGVRDPIDLATPLRFGVPVARASSRGSAKSKQRPSSGSRAIVRFVPSPR